jgi:hypothetical protein
MAVDILNPILSRVLSALRFNSSSTRKLICAIKSLLSFLYYTAFTNKMQAFLYTFAACVVDSFASLK